MSEDTIGAFGYPEMSATIVGLIGYPDFSLGYGCDSLS